MDEYNRRNDKNEEGNNQEEMNYEERNQEGGTNEMNQNNEGNNNERNNNERNYNERNNNERNNDEINQGAPSEPNYVFWAEAAEADKSKELRQPQYEAATYSYKKTELNENGNYYNNANNSYNNDANGQASNYGSDYSAGGQDRNPKKDKKPHGFGMKLAKTAAIAAVFGLVAGGVFQGVNWAANSAFPNNGASTSALQNNTQISSTALSTGTNTTTDLTSLVSETMPSIVSITSTMTQDYNYFGQVYSEEYDGSGSGIIVAQNDTELLIATNNHVVEGATAIAVNFIDNKVYEAKVKGTDASADLAVVAVQVKDMDKETLNSIKIATLGDSEDVEVGQMAIAIGNALGSGQSVTVGYISAKNRVVNTSSTSQGSQLELLQTDAAINPGNSGGALLNINGEVIGINDMKYADTDVEGMGYAIPISEAIPIINDLMNREILEEDEKGYLGITGENITEENNVYDMPIGVYVQAVGDGGAADEAGIKKGDIITEVNGVSTKTMDAIQQKVNYTRAGTEIKVTIMRADSGEYKEMEFTVKLKDVSSLDSLSNSATESTNQGNFGYDSQRGNNSEGDSEQTQPQAPAVPEQGQSGAQSEEDINDLLQDFFNQFN